MAMAPNTVGFLILAEQTVEWMKKQTNFTEEGVKGMNRDETLHCELMVRIRCILTTYIR